MNLSEVLVRPVGALEQQRFQKLMQKHHYLGALRKISETLWYVATFVDQWVALYFKDRQEPDFIRCDPPDHGRIEIPKIWTTSELNGYLNFPHVAQTFVVQREFTDKKTGKYSCEIAYGITSRPLEQASPQRVLATNRGHWCIENSCHYIIDWNYHNDRSRIRTGHGPENITCLRRLAIASLNPKGYAVAQKMRQLMLNVRLVFDYLRMTENSCAGAFKN